MPNNIILKAENLSKQYQLGVFGTRTLSGDVHRWWMTKVRGKEDPFSKVGVVNDRASKEKVDFVWALKDINFEVKRGEVLGIIGKNGAGKSTLLKLLSRVTSPTTGRIRSNGRMASLLEVGTGFHPELTGLENIYLNGAILGMTKAEIKRKLDEIIDFSGCALYIDTPVKRYSSGMKVRLGFAVAAFLDPEILIVDEVLAVGDAEFQKKAIGKMKDVSQGEGRTILFVSHNLSSVLNLCDRGILLTNGMASKVDNIDEIVSEYLSMRRDAPLEFENEHFKLDSFTVNDLRENIIFSNGTEISIRLKYHLKKPVPNVGFCFLLHNNEEELISAINTYHVDFPIQKNNPGEYALEFTIPKYLLNTGRYYFDLNFNTIDGTILFKSKNLIEFEIIDDGVRRGKKYSGAWPGYLSLIPNFKTY